MVTVEVPTVADFRSIARLKAAAFADKWQEDDHGAVYRKLNTKYPDKIQHCRVAKIEDVVVGTIQLQLKDDPGDMDFPGFMRHTLKTGESYIEFIATDPNFRGQGVGSALLEWATTYSESNGCSSLTLDVMKKNEGAIRLYERRGFNCENPDDSTTRCIASCVICLVSCGKYWNVEHMVKPLTNPASTRQEIDR